jgi:hypothetical protein
MATMAEAGVGAETGANILGAGYDRVGGAAQCRAGRVSRLRDAAHDAEVLRLSLVAAAYPSSIFWKVLAYNQTHVEWFGCSLHDTIQPGFSFLVGVALPYSLASRMAKGARFAELFGHALWRSWC